ncbi:papain-like cysteine protease family protein [Streptomyces sp. NPDC057565]|uniref:papain-like cysteine protease family protein n=1 Tax=Streptomyces sp. NPDC057565 TaxID=3346169 RepID=UPI00369CD6E1
MSLKPESTVRSSDEIQFTMQHQEQDFWCWTATASSVADYYDTTNAHPQCFLVEWAFQNPTCCESGETDECNRTFAVDLALIKVGHYSTSQAGALGFRDIVAEVTRRRPVVVRILWPAGNKHAVAVTGYIEIPPPDGFHFPFQYLTVRDSVYGTSYVHYDWFCSDYQGLGGTWAYTFFTKG